MELSDKGVEALARSLSTRSVDEAFDWVARNLRDTGYAKTNYGARHALEKREGDCTEFLYLFIAVTRLQNIPSRLIGGFVIDERGALRAENYHNWAEFLEGGVWMIANPYRKVRRTSQGYVAFRVAEEEQGENAQRFLSFDKRLEISLG